jgi:hypothetical protein
VSRSSLCCTTPPSVSQTLPSARCCRAATLWVAISVCTASAQPLQYACNGQLSGLRFFREACIAPRPSWTCQADTAACAVPAPPRSSSRCWETARYATPIWQQHCSVWARRHPPPQLPVYDAACPCGSLQTIAAMALRPTVYYCCPCRAAACRAAAEAGACGGWRRRRARRGGRGC